MSFKFECRDIDTPEDSPPPLSEVFHALKLVLKICAKGSLFLFPFAKTVMDRHLYYIYQMLFQRYFVSCCIMWDPLCVRRGLISGRLERS